MQPMWVQTAESAVTWLPLRVRNPSIAPERKAIGVPSGSSASALTAFQVPFSTNGRDAVFGVAVVTCSIPNTAATPAAMPAAPASRSDRRLGGARGQGGAGKEGARKPPPVALGERGEQRVHPLRRFGILARRRRARHVVIQLTGAFGVILAPVVGQGRLGHPVQPAAQLRDRDIAAHPADRLHEHLGGEVLGVGAVTDPAVDVLVDGSDMCLVSPGQVILAVRRVGVWQRQELPGGSEHRSAAWLILTHPLPQLYTAPGYVARAPGQA